MTWLVLLIFKTWSWGGKLFLFLLIVQVISRGGLYITLSSSRDETERSAEAEGQEVGPAAVDDADIKLEEKNQAMYDELAELEDDVKESQTSTFPRRKLRMVMDLDDDEE